jgi:hypothetical protein
MPSGEVVMIFALLFVVALLSCGFKLLFDRMISSFTRFTSPAVPFIINVLMLSILLFSMHMAYLLLGVSLND